MSKTMPIFVNPEIHRRLKILAAEQSVSMRALAERLLGLAMSVGDPVLIIGRNAMQEPQGDE